MARDEAYQRAEWKIEMTRREKDKELNLNGIGLIELPESISQLIWLESLNIFGNKLTALPEQLSSLTKLLSLDVGGNRLMTLPEWLEQFQKLKYLNLSYNSLVTLPESVSKLSCIQQLEISNNQLQLLPEFINRITTLRSLNLSYNQLTILPDSFEQLTKIQEINLSENQISDLPPSLGSLKKLKEISLRGNPLNLELAAAYNDGSESIKHYLRAKAAAQIKLNEAKLILVGEGEVGKTCLTDALLGNPWLEHDTTHGIQIKPIKLTDPDSQTEITLNGWDFGGQRVYRPTHQLFFSAPAVYLVVWKPREGPQQGFVKEWIQLVKRREPSAKIIVVATHGGPQQRQPDIDRQELWDTFGNETVVDFFFVDSKPDEHGNRKGIEELKRAIARVAVTLPEVGRSVPKSFQDVRQALGATGAPYLPLDEVLAICRAHNMDDEIARLFITISHRLGHLTHYENDPALRDIVILRPDWLASAMSYVLDDEATRAAHGLVKFSRLGHLWDDPTRPADTRYPDSLHRIFLALMGRFDLSYRVAGLSPNDDSDPVSLIAQLVPDKTPDEKDFEKAWLPEIAAGDTQQTQICRIVDSQNGQSANAEGLFFQLIVRLHRYSLGRVKYADSVHWQRGLVLDGDYNGRALLRHIGNDVHITVRAAYPQGFLTILTDEVKFLVESFWEGLKCEVTVPCLNPNPCKGLFEVSKLIDNKKQNRLEQPCPTCNYWQSIDQLLLNAPASRPLPQVEFLATQKVLDELSELRKILIKHDGTTIGRFDNLDTSQRELLSQAETSYKNLLQVFTDEAKEGPRLFSIRPVDPNWLETPKKLVSQKFRILLWCEHSQLPLFVLNQEGDQRGIYEMDLPYEWVVKAAPYLKALTATLSLILPVASSATKLMLPETQYKAIENQLSFSKDVFDSISKGAAMLRPDDAPDAPELPHGAMQRAEGALLREFHSFLKEKDPGFGGLVRVMDKQQKYLWVHEQFAGEY